jgi:hypothetical protein
VLVRYHLTHHYAIFLYFVKDGFLQEYIDSYNCSDGSHLVEKYIKKYKIPPSLLVIEQSEEKVIRNTPTIFSRLCNGTEVFWGENHLFTILNEDNV